MTDQKHAALRGLLQPPASQPYEHYYWHSIEGDGVADCDPCRRERQETAARQDPTGPPTAPRPAFDQLLLRKLNHGRTAFSSQDLLDAYEVGRLESERRWRAILWPILAPLWRDTHEAFKALRNVLTGDDTLPLPRD